MSSSGGGAKKKDVDSSDLPEEPLVDTPLLNRLDQMDAPTPSDFSERMIKLVRDNVRQRRTNSAIAQRAANLAVTPISEALQMELTERVQRRIDKRLDQMRNSD